LPNTTKQTTPAWEGSFTCPEPGCGEKFDYERYGEIPDGYFQVAHDHSTDPPQWQGVLFTRPTEAAPQQEPKN